MKKLLSIFLAFLMLTSTLLGLTSCGDENDAGAEVSAYLLDEVYGLDPALDYTGDDAQLAMSLLYEPLFTLNKNGKVKYAAAKKYKWDRDTGDLLITLRESYWSNDQRVFASDFVFAWRRLLDSSFSSPAAALLYDVKNAVAVKTGAKDIYDLGLQVVDKETIRISFEDPENLDRKAFLRNLASIQLSPVCQTPVEKSPDNWAKSAASIITNGPFKLRQLSYEHGYFTLARNDGYHRPAGSGKAVDYYVAPYQIRTLWKTDDSVNDMSYLAQMYEHFAGDAVFFIGGVSESAIEASGLPKKIQRQLKVKVLERLSTYTLLFNQNNPLFADKNVRQALASVIDREVLMELMEGTPAASCEIATGLIAPAVMDARAGRSFRKVGKDILSAKAAMDVASANRMLDTALGTDRGITTIELVCGDDTMSFELASYLQQLWGALSFDVRFMPVSSIEVEENGSTYYDDAIQHAYETGSYDVIALDYQMMSTSAFASLCAFTTTLNGNGAELQADGTMKIRGNYVGYSSTAYDALMKSALDADSTKERTKYLHQAEELLLADFVVVPLMFNVTSYACSGKLKNVSFTYNGFPVFTNAKLKKYDRYTFDDLQSVLFPEEG